MRTAGCRGSREGLGAAFADVCGCGGSLGQGGWGCPGKCSSTQCGPLGAPLHWPCKAPPSCPGLSFLCSSRPRRLARVVTEGVSSLCEVGLKSACGGLWGAPSSDPASARGRGAGAPAGGPGGRRQGERQREKGNRPVGATWVSEVANAACNRPKVTLRQVSKDRGKERREGGGGPRPGPTPTPSLARTVGSTTYFPRGWSLRVWLREGSFCLALGPLSSPSLLLPGDKSTQQPWLLLVRDHRSPAPGAKCRWGSPGHAGGWSTGPREPSDPRHGALVCPSRGPPC